MNHRSFRMPSLAEISLHRPILYGFAALWLAFYHMESYTPTAVLREFKGLGVCGVEMFVLLSGCGLYRSMERNPDVAAFYRRRFQRVFLPSAIVAALYFGINAGGVLRYVAATAMLPYWLNVRTFWYAAFILTMYLIYPAVYALQKRSPALLWGLVALSVIPAMAVSLFNNAWARYCYLGVCRIPIFLLGCALAPRFSQDRPISAWALPASLLGAFVIQQIGVRLPVQFNFLYRLFCLCLAFFLMLGLTFLARVFTRGAIRRFVYRFFTLCGGVSLEIYLLFDRITHTLRRTSLYTSGTVGDAKLELFGLLLTIVGSLLLVRLSRFLIDSFAGIRIPEAAGRCPAPAKEP